MTPAQITADLIRDLDRDFRVIGTGTEYLRFRSRYHDLEDNGKREVFQILKRSGRLSPVTSRKRSILLASEIVADLIAVKRVESRS